MKGCLVVAEKSENFEEVLKLHERYDVTDVSQKGVLIIWVTLKSTILTQIIFCFQVSTLLPSVSGFASCAGNTPSVV